ncbi:lipid IV(A) 4-amino-4-deoxy-L-arabinosyltransferase [Morganella morganii]|uniref:lipid IV(A) 4-amino-4-deoxy-L-arabinosyltransferase n=2 Tax=Morganella morganii TaxID=582 RepID=UPI00068ED2C8|nr:lipid IV(A) 4-amino-4-deoxy-L-arabinosyltransferase [Morganella morganii]AUU01540.1 lipid IV(A) 4-amino-4-deoxy-L-arabinosyltransferase [Morganella morganii]AVD59799.1 lipid IV(A) 4-amino-4-deoxy-L-arabinosyltransferase [Morganella morganii]EHZ6677083.1 lipid IV(A) 4-amino-4-deoxy-L-arabinosyltransferase [Morganella morganii]EKU8060132.1 lipid IV(A) 4-amino-4-deoxy-L-arabinosyltransferase [Morganella morganii]EKW8499420.1 lipid IV(A) 4-amino-4-deoxy-L-arabinosyltransferase [Morganella morga
MDVTSRKSAFNVAYPSAAMWAVLFLLFIAVTYFIPLEFRALWQPDETRYAEISREMLADGNWVVPHLLDIRYFEKPVAGYWVNNISQMLFGHTQFAVRFGVLFSTMISTLLVYRLAMKMWDEKVIARTAAFLYASMLLVLALGTYSTLDPILTMWVTLVIYLSYGLTTAQSRRALLGYWITFGLACGMALMTKGFLALVLPVIALIPVHIFYRRFKTMLCYCWAGIAAAGLITLPWALAIYHAEPDFWRYFVMVEHIQRFMSKEAQNLSPFWFFIPILFAGVLPWSGFLFGALKQGWQQRRENKPLFFLLCWTVLPFLFFSIAKGKLLTYILPVIAPLTILMAAYIHTLMKKQSVTVFRLNAVINIIFGCCAVIALLVINNLENTLVYSAAERGKFIGAIAIFLFWIVVSALTLIKGCRYWMLAAFCTVAISLSVSSLLPERTERANLPQIFIQKNAALLKDARYILVNSVGIGTSAAWELQRSDIYMFDRPGELKYGLSDLYPDTRERFISHDDFESWLKNARKTGNVALILRDRHGVDENDVSPADEMVTDENLTLLYYRKMP